MPSVLGFRKFLKAKKFMDKREGRSLKSFLRNFSSHSAEKLCRGNLEGVSVLEVSKHFRLHRVMSLFFVELFLSHSAEKLRRGTL